MHLIWYNVIINSANPFNKEALCISFTRGYHNITLSHAFSSNLWNNDPTMTNYDKQNKSCKNVKDFRSFFLKWTCYDT
jgi:hypothetical protein